MRIASPILLALALSCFVLPSPVRAQSDLQAIIAGLQELVQRQATSEEINRFLQERHTVAEKFCATIPEHRDCLRKPTLKVEKHETGTIRVLDYSRRMAPGAAFIHVAFVCLQAGTGSLRVQPIGAGGAELAPKVTAVVCPTQHDTVHLDLELAGEYRFGRSDATTATQFVLDVLAP